MLKWFESYLSRRTYLVKINQEYSNPVTSLHGVPQGSVLGPLLFKGYCLPLARVIEKHNIAFHMYADDKQLLLLLLLLLLFAPNVKGKWVDSNFQIIDLLVPPRMAGVAGTLIFCSHCKFCYTTTLAACRIFYLPYFNSLYTHKGPVLLCVPPRHRAM